jgi:hypothetical protein
MKAGTRSISTETGAIPKTERNPLMAVTATEQKAAYILLNSAMYHAQDFDATRIFENCKHLLAKEMTLPTLAESLDLVTLLVWPRFGE